MERLNVDEVVVGNPRTTTTTTTSHPKDVPARPAPMPGSEDNTLECVQCFIIFSEARAMLRHNRKFHKEEYIQHLQKNNTVFVCYKCNKGFLSPDKLRQHGLTHGPRNKPFSCENCRKIYATLAELLSHRRDECQKPKFRCKTCSTCFYNLDTLLAHKALHNPKKLGRRPKKYAPESEPVWRNTDEMLIMPDHRGIISTPQTSWSQDTKIVTLKEEEDEEEICSPVNDGDLALPSMGALRVHKEDVHGPLPATGPWTPDKNIMVPKKEEEEELDHRGKDQRALEHMKTLLPERKEEEVEEEVADTAEEQRSLWAQTSSPQGGASESQQPRYNIPCSVGDCDLTFSSIEELRVHKKGDHGPRRTPNKKTIVVPKEEEEEEEEEVAGKGKGALTVQTSWSLDMKTLVPKEEEEVEEVAGKGKGALTVQTSWSLDMKTLVPKEEEVEVGADVAGTAEDQRVLRSQSSWPPDKKTMVPEEEEEEEEVEVAASTAEDQSAQMTNPQQPMKDGQLPKKKPRYSIPCPMDDCDLTFSSVEELKAHKKDVHRPQPAPERAPPRLP